MHETLDPDKIPPKYWCDRAWLGLPEELQHPTCFHLLGIEPEELGTVPVAKLGIDTENRIRDQAKRNPSAGELANEILKALAMARSTLDTPVP